MIVHIDAILDKVIKFLLVALLTVLLVVLSYQILSRHMPFLPAALWSEEFARFVFIWLILIGATKAFMTRSHFTIDFFEAFESAFLLRITNVLINVIRLGISYFFVVHGYEYVVFGLMQNSDYMGVNMGLYVYSSIFLSAIIWFLASTYFFCERVYQLYEAVVEVKS